MTKSAQAVSQPTMTAAQVLAATRNRFRQSPEFGDATQAVRESWTPYLEDVARFESGNENVRQRGGGPGSGPWQVEGPGGSDTLTTASNRLERLYPGNQVSKKVRSGSVTSAMQLSREEQKALMYGNVHGHPKTRVAEGVGHTREFLDANPGARHTLDVWRDSHWGGSGDNEWEKRVRRFYSNFPDAVPTPEHERVLGGAQVADTGLPPPQSEPPIDVPIRAGTTKPSAPGQASTTAPAPGGDLNKQSQSETGFHAVELGGVRNDPLYWGLRAGAAGSALGLGYAALRERIRRQHGGEDRTAVVKPMLAGAFIGTVLGTLASAKYGVNIPGYKAKSWDDVGEYVKTTAPDRYKYGSDSKYRGLLLVTDMEKRSAIVTGSLVGLGLVGKKVLSWLALKKGAGLAAGGAKAVGAGAKAAPGWLGKAFRGYIGVHGARDVAEHAPKAVGAAGRGDWGTAGRHAVHGAVGAYLAGTGLSSAGRAMQVMGRATPWASKGVAGTTLSSGTKMFAPGTWSRKHLGRFASKGRLARAAAQPAKTMSRSDAAMDRLLKGVGGKLGPRSSAAMSRIGGGVERAGAAMSPGGKLLFPSLFVGAPESGVARPAARAARPVARAAARAPVRAAAGHGSNYLF